MVAIFFSIIDALYILTTTPKQRFEFIFTDYGTNPTHFASVFEIYRIYQSTSLYRELKLRGAILTDGQLNILPQEQVYKQMNGVYNLSSDQGNLGVFIITNIRLVWFADANGSFNISLPFMQMSSLRLRESKYGLALVIQTATTAGNYVLGFRIDPQEKLQEVYKEISTLHTVYSQTPIFGVNYDFKPTVMHLQMFFPLMPWKLQDKEEDPLRIDDIPELDNVASSEINSKFTAYLSQGDSEKHRQPFYCKELGFAMEKLRDGYTIKDLWNVMGSAGKWKYFRSLVYSFVFLKLQRTYIVLK